MTNKRNFVALGAAMAIAVVSQVAVAQQDLDNLLAELDAETGAKPAVEVKPAAPEPEPAAVAAEVAKEAAPAAEEAPAADAAAASDAEPAASEAKPAASGAEQGGSASDAAELLENIRNTEMVRRQTLDQQAKSEFAEARQCMENEEYLDAIRHYSLALKLFNDSPMSKDLRKECRQGVAEGLYQAALQENELGRRERAQKLMEKAVDQRHPKARRVLEKWALENAAAGRRVDLTDVKHRVNDEDYKELREQIRKHLRRSRQYLAVKDLTKALEECEVVLVKDPDNADAIRIREAIQKKRKVILQQERKAARDGWIADVDEKWRPVYAVNAAELETSAAETVKTQAGEDPERTVEQSIEKRMKEMRLPTISFKPPATIIEAVDFFRTASRDYDRPDIPAEKRGFNFVLNTPQGALKTQSQQNDDVGFGDESAAETATANGLPPIPTINASDISFYEALKLVCDSVDYKFIVRGSVVMVMHKDQTTAELISRKYNVPEAFIERVNTASDEVKQLLSQGGFGNSSRKQNDDGEESQEKDWKGFFEQMGVKWPEGSSITHIKALGKLYVRNSRENLAEFEKVLEELGATPPLIEIETRFVEVSQEDLNSLGFEWILNSDYSLNIGEQLGKALGINNGFFGTESGKRTWSTENGSSALTEVNGSWVQSGNGARDPSPDAGTRFTGLNSAMSKYTDNYERSIPISSQGGTWLRGDNSTGRRNIGINAFGGTSDYNKGNRYLSTAGNHISGESKSTNDQFMRVNAFLGAADVSMILHMLSQRSDTDLLSAPKVVTRSGEQAVIKVVTEYIYPQDYDVQLQSSSSSSGGYGSGSGQSAILAVVEPQNFTMREVGVILDVTPSYIEANGGTIELELKPAVVDEPVWHNYGMKIPFSGNSGGDAGVMGISSIVTDLMSAITALPHELLKADNDYMYKSAIEVAKNGLEGVTYQATQGNMAWYDAPMEQPFFHVRSIDSKVSITPGSTVVMGGLITEARKAMDDKIPFLGDLPFIGRLFRSHAEQTIKRNLLIFVTGRLITPSGREMSFNKENTATLGDVKAAPTEE